MVCKLLGRHFSADIDEVDLVFLEVVCPCADELFAAAFGNLLKKWRFSGQSLKVISLSRPGALAAP